MIWKRPSEDAITSIKQAKAMARLVVKLSNLRKAVFMWM
jgi:hypothetical protein